MTIRTIMVAGAGTMGNGTAQVRAENGFETLLYDVAGELHVCGNK